MTSVLDPPTVPTNAIASSTDVTKSVSGSKGGMTRDEALKVLAVRLSGQLGPSALLEQDWRLWLTTLFRKWVSSIAGDLVPFAEHHEQFWNHVWNIQSGVKPRPLAVIWPRGGAKSTSAELACVALGAMRRRKYVLYISATQEQADDHIQNIGALLEHPTFAQYYPGTSNRMVGKYGSSKGWRRNRLRTRSGFTADAIGLDTAARGVKLENVRPDLLILDDIDEELDSPTETDKKVTILTRKLLPAGSSDSAVICVQNQVINNGVFHRLSVPPSTTVDGIKGAEFLQNRIISGPHKAIIAPQILRENGKYLLVGGTPTWQGQDLAVCQRQIEEWGYSSWLIEAQHEVDSPEGGLFGDIDFERLHVHLSDVPELIRIVVWVDPAVTSTDKSDSHGIHADGLGVDGKVYRLRSWEGRGTPAVSLHKAISWALELKAEHVGVETDQGGDLWELAYNNVWEEMVRSGEVYLPVSVVDDSHMRRDTQTLGLSQVQAASSTTTTWLKPNFVSEKAGAGYGPKAHRASRMLVDYEHDVFRHVLGTHDVLERALKRFPIRKPFDLTDAAFWAWNDLKGGTEIGVGASDDSAATPYSRMSLPNGTSIGVPTPEVPLRFLSGRPMGTSMGRIWQGHTRVGSQTIWRRPTEPVPVPTPVEEEV